jgi:hypothetical protein
MEYRGEDENDITRAEVTQKLKSWWKDKSISEEEWQSWASKVTVTWSAEAKRGDQ